MTRRDLLQILSTAPVSVGMALAGGGGGGRRDRSDGRVTIRYMAWGNPEQIAVERRIAREFEKRNPGIRVHLFMVPGSAYADKLQLMLASRTAPDVMRADRYYFPALARKNYFLPLEPLIAPEKPGFLNDFLPIAVDEGRWNGTLFGMNVLFGPVMIYYNRALFEKAGLPDPYKEHKRGRWDWENFIGSAQALTRRDAAGRATVFGSTVPTFPQYVSVLWNHGGSLTDPNITRLTLAEDAGAIRGMQRFVDMRWKERVAPTPADSALSAFTFESGKIAMHWGWAGESPRFRKNIKDFEWDIVPTPSGPAGNATVVKGNQLVIHRESEHPEESWEFIKFMTGPEAEMLLYGELRRAVPTRRSVLRDPAYLRANLPPYQTDVFLESVQRGRTLPIDWRYQEWAQEFNSALEPLMNVEQGSKDAGAALARAAARANRILGGEEGF